LGSVASGVDHESCRFPCAGEDELLYVLAVGAVPIALMCAMLIMERLEHHVLGPCAHADETRQDEAVPAVPPTSPMKHPIDAQSPRAA
jgi:hypothetical protein